MDTEYEGGFLSHRLLGGDAMSRTGISCTVRSSYSPPLASFTIVDCTTTRTKKDSAGAAGAALPAVDTERDSPETDSASADGIGHEPTAAGAGSGSGSEPHGPESGTATTMSSPGNTGIMPLHPPPPGVPPLPTLQSHLARRSATVTSAGRRLQGWLGGRSITAAALT